MKGELDFLSSVMNREYQGLFFLMLLPFSSVTEHKTSFDHPLCGVNYSRVEERKGEGGEASF